MAEPHFFRRPSGLTVGEIAVLTGAIPSTGARLDHLITNIAPLDRASPSDLAFLDTARYADALASTQAGACLTTKRFEQQAPSTVNVLCTHEPYGAFVAVARKLYPDALRPSSLFEAKGVAPEAIVHPSARIEKGVVVDPGAVIGPRAAIGAGTVSKTTWRSAPARRLTGAQAVTP
jgi:UDP-3-O-[3-hydroxymyristoyl] glucosamine N-acyltransferase